MSHSTKRRHLQLSISKKTLIELKEPGDKNPLMVGYRAMDDMLAIKRGIDRVQDRWGTRRSDRLPVRAVVHRLVEHLRNREYVALIQGSVERNRLAKFTGLSPETDAVTLVFEAAMFTAFNPFNRMLRRRRNKKTQAAQPLTPTEAQNVA